MQVDAKGCGSRRHGNRGKRDAVAVCAALWLASAVTVMAASPGGVGDFEANIQRVFADGWADIRVTFGYDNYMDLKDPSDPGRAERLMKYLAKQGFHAVSPTPEVAKYLGVPVTAQNLRIFDGMSRLGRGMRVSFIWSAATSSEAKNIGSEQVRQALCSADALNFMQRAAREAEVMLYVGHSRGGGGPDTHPPVTLMGAGAERRRVDFSYYRRERPGLAALGPSFARSPSTPLFIAWTGCLSHRHFSAWLTGMLGGKTHPTCLVLSTRLIRHKPWEPEIEGNDENLMAAISVIEALMTHQPRREFEQRLMGCEMDELRDPLKPAWKLSILPGKRPARIATLTTAAPR